MVSGAWNDGIFTYIIMYNRELNDFQDRSDFKLFSLNYYF